MSAHRVRALAEAGVKDNATSFDLNQLSQIGSSGRCPQNEERDLVRHAKRLFPFMRDLEFYEVYIESSTPEDELLMKDLVFFEWPNN